MKALLIGGTGTISMAITRLLVEKKWEVWLMNRGNRSNELPDGINLIQADMNNEEDVRDKIKDMTFDSFNKSMIKEMSGLYNICVSLLIHLSQMFGMKLNTVMKDFLFFVS